MKKYSILVIALLMATIALFQNCSGAQSMKDGFLNKVAVEEVTETVEENKDQTIYPYNVSEGDNLTLAAPEKDFKEYLLDGICQWTYTDTIGTKKTIDNPESALTLPRIQSSQAGDYALYCETSERQHTFIFRVTVGEGSGGATKDTLKIYLITSGVSALNTTTPDVTENRALSNCVTIGNQYIAKGVSCTWGAKVIYTRAAGDPATIPDVYKVYYITGGVSTLMGQTADVLQSTALADCNARAAANPTKGITCVWGTSTIFSRAEPPVVVETRLGVLYFGQNNQFREVGRQADVTRAAGLKLCQDNAAKYPQYQVKCMWGSELIYKRGF